jgi:hypothetical protein
VEDELYTLSDLVELVGVRSLIFNNSADRRIMQTEVFT